MGVFDDIKEIINNYFNEVTTNYGKSKKWLEYKLGPTLTHCYACAKRQNKIYDIMDYCIPELPEHEKCACYLTPLRSLLVGKATKKGNEGADYYIYYYKTLPNYYITKEEALKMGWSAWKGNLDKVAPGNMIGGNIFANRENKLPDAPGRVWHECDIDYMGGYRNNYRLIYSNDGLIFKTDNHYDRFIAIEG